MSRIMHVFQRQIVKKIGIVLRSLAIIYFELGIIVKKSAIVLITVLEKLVTQMHHTTPRQGLCEKFQRGN